MLKGTEKEIPGSVSLSGSAPKLIGVYSRPRPIIHPGFVEICSLVFV